MYGRVSVCVCVCVCVCLCVTYVYVCIVPNLGTCLQHSRLAYHNIDGGKITKYTETLLLDTSKTHLCIHTDTRAYKQTYMLTYRHTHIISCTKSGHSCTTTRWDANDIFNFLCLHTHRHYYLYQIWALSFSLAAFCMTTRWDANDILNMLFDIGLWGYFIWCFWSLHEVPPPPPHLPQLFVSVYLFLCLSFRLFLSVSHNIGLWG